MLAAQPKTIALRCVYGTILFVVSLATLEGFGQLNDEFLHVPARLFHQLMMGGALVVAAFEATTMRGLDGLRDYLGGQDYVIEPMPEGTYSFRGAYLEDIPVIRRLARRIYGWGYDFSDDRLRAWRETNPYCFFLMLFNSEVVGYLDAFPVAEADFQHLVRGGDEKQIMPLPPAQVDTSSSFYVASFVVTPEHRPAGRSFVVRALTFYRGSYPIRSWNKICGLAYTHRGKEWLSRLGFDHIEDSKMWTLSRTHLGALKPGDRALWSRLFD